MQITVVGNEYISLSISILLARQNEIIMKDTMLERIELINKKEFPIQDADIQKYLSTQNLHLKATLDTAEAYKDADFVVITVPTTYDSQNDSFDTSAVEKAIDSAMAYNPNAILVLKSTVPVGFTASIREKKGCKNILYSPNFARESKALYDHLYPARIIVGTDMEDERLVEVAHTFASLLKDTALKEDVEVRYMGFSEAEAVKLFENTYSALQVSFFNEMDTFAQKNELNIQQILAGVCSDPSIENDYSEPSFGYGGYCLQYDNEE